MIENKLASIITDINFEQLELSLQEPNIFKALSIQRMELKHSSFISYLLDPNKNHGLESLFLKKFLRDIFSDSKANNRSIFDVDNIDLTRVEIRREWRNIDILIILPDDVVIIENKVDTMDHSNQLQRYRRIVDEVFEKYNKHFVFLTPFGVDPNDEKAREVYINYSYSQISLILKALLDLYSNNLSNKVKIFIEDYLDTINLELLMSDRRNEVAQNLYLAHKEAFDFIFENRPDPATTLYPYFEKEITARKYVIGSKNKGSIRFLSPQLINKIPKSGVGWPNKEAFLFEIDYFWSDKYAIVNAIISPCDETTREKIISSVKRSKYFKEPPGKKWLVFYKEKVPFTASEMVNEDPEEIESKVKNILDKSEPAIKEFINFLEQVF